MAACGGEGLSSRPPCCAAARVACETKQTAAASSVLRRASFLANARARCECAWRTFARTLARRARTTARSPCGFRPRERSPCESHGGVLLNPAGPRRSLTRMDLPARMPRGIRIVTIAARHCRRSSPTNNTTWEFKKRKLFQMKNQKQLEFLWVVFRGRFPTQI